MKVIILGGDGMIGHKIYQSLYNSGLDLIVTSRKKRHNLKIDFNKSEVFNIDVFNEDIKKILKIYKPNYIVNCIGITTRRFGENNIDKITFCNSKFPHILSEWAQKNNSKLIHFSTDCVFSGITGDYTENSTPDASDIYGFTKAKGEVLNCDNTLTIRTSMIGREVYNQTELLEWILSQNNKEISGYVKAIYSGVTTCWMGNVIARIIKENINLSGLYNISSNSISKYELINLLCDTFNLNIKINENHDYASNKSLISRKFFERTDIDKPSWETMLINLKKDSQINKNIYIN
tara:strand:- start:353 stop:1228 length:876 start_codon:yes stop_codon:yes gene_type:complete